jgi:hypothetical protein
MEECKSLTPIWSPANGKQLMIVLLGKDTAFGVGNASKKKKKEEEEM